jgi:4-hydroxy-3-methylbut-2-enyl diphosphate reductase
VVVIEKVEEFSLNTEDIPSLLIPQTTADPLKFAELQSKMSTVISDLKVYNAICPFVSKREKELRNFAKSCDAIIFVGGAHSSNTAVLFSVCKQVNPNSFFVEKPEDLPGEKLSQFELIGVSGSASTPMWQLEEIAEVISQKFIMNN